MPFCRACGKFVEEGDDYCPKCGASQHPSNGYEAPPSSGVNDGGGIGWAVLGFFIPLAGLIIYLLWKDQKPNTANMAGLGALVWLIVWLGVSLLLTLLH